MSKKLSLFSWPTLAVAITGFAVLSSVTFVLVAARARSTAQTDTTPGHRVLAPKSKVDKKDPVERVEMVQITIRSTGFDPTDIEYPSKPFLMAVDNQSGMDDLDLELLAEDSAGKSHAKIRNLKMSLTALSSREITHLQPGRYLLKETNHPEWICHLTISEK